MSLILFWIFAGLMLLFGLGVVLMRNPVSSAMCLVVSFVGLASLFFTLDAFFIGIIQILVYAGAVMVLFLFIIMLLDLKAAPARKLNVMAWTGSGLVLVGFVALMMQVVLGNPALHAAMPALIADYDDVQQIGLALFTNFNFPFQIVGVLLLVATVGVVVLSRKELK